MTAACHKSINGLAAGHAYTILGVNSRTGRIMMRNPWAEEEYYGEGADWWDDGQFEIPIDTFAEAFPNFSILSYRRWLVSSLEPQQGKPGYQSGWKFLNPID